MKSVGINQLNIQKNIRNQYHITGMVWPQIDKYNQLLKIDVTDDSEDLNNLLEEFVSALDYLGYIKH